MQKQSVNLNLERGNVEIDVIKRQLLLPLSQDKMGSVNGLRSPSPNPLPVGHRFETKKESVMLDLFDFNPLLGEPDPSNNSLHHIDPYGFVVRIFPTSLD